MAGPIEQKKEALISETSAALILYHEWGCSWTHHYGEQLCLLSLADRSLSPGECHLRENRHRYFQKHSVSSLFLNVSLLAAQKSEKYCKVDSTWMPCLPVFLSSTLHYFQLYIISAPSDSCNDFRKSIILVWNQLVQIFIPFYHLFTFSVEFYNFHD